GLPAGACERWARRGFLYRRSRRPGAWNRCARGFPLVAVSADAAACACARRGRRSAVSGRQYPERTSVPSRLTARWGQLAKSNFHACKLIQRRRRRRKAIRGILREQAIDQALKSAHRLGEHGERVIAMRLDDRDDRIAAERALAREHLVEDHAETVEIAALIDRRAFGLLRADVVRRAAHLADVREMAVVHRLCEAEVDQHDASVGPHHD